MSPVSPQASSYGGGGVSVVAVLVRNWHFGDSTHKTERRWSLSRLGVRSGMVVIFIRYLC